jgi:hypothetical protein
VRRWLAALVGLVLLVSCSNGDRKTAGRATRSASPSPTVTSTASPSPSPAANPSPSPAASIRPSSLPTRRPRIVLPSSPAVRIPVVSDQVRLPAPGDYVYDLTGSSTGLTGAAQPYPPGATQTIRVSPGPPGAGGTELQTVTTSPQEPSVQTTARSRWEPTRVRLLSTVIQLGPLANYPCTYDPAPEIIRIPPAAGVFPQQSFSGACSGTLDVAVAGPENVTAAGRTWRTWKVHSRSTFAMQVGLTGTIDTTMWLAPELGEPVRGETAIEAQLLATRLSAHQSTVLRAHP